MRSRSTKKRQSKKKKRVKGKQSEAELGSVSDSGMPNWARMGRGRVMAEDESGEHRVVENAKKWEEEHARAPSRQDEKRKLTGLAACAFAIRKCDVAYEYSELKSLLDALKVCIKKAEKVYKAEIAPVNGVTKELAADTTITLHRSTKDLHRRS